jgi:heptosyltransferase III
LKKILIYHIGQLGDTLVTIPAIDAIKLKHQNCSITLLTDKHSEKKYVNSWEVLKLTSNIDKVVFYDPSQIFKLHYLIKLIKRLRDIRPSYVYNIVLRANIKNKWRDYLFFKFLFTFSKYSALDIVQYPINKSKGLKIMPPQWQRILEQVGSSEQIKKIQLGSDKDSLIGLEKKLAGYNFSSSKRRFIIGPSSKMPSKCWDSKSFVELGFKLIEEFNTPDLLILGGLEDRNLANDLLSEWGMNDNNFCGELSLGESAELIRQSDIYIGNDSGIMHLSAMVGTPCVSIFSGRDYPGLWEPFGSNNISIRKDINCSGCMLSECLQNKNACLNLIAVNEVFSAVIKILSIDD